MLLQGNNLCQTTTVTTLSEHPLVSTYGQNVSTRHNAESISSICRSLNYISSTQAWLIDLLLPCFQVNEHISAALHPVWTTWPLNWPAWYSIGWLHLSAEWRNITKIIIHRRFPIKPTKREKSDYIGATCMSKQHCKVASAYFDIA